MSGRAEVRPGGKVHHKHVIGLQALFLHAGGCNIDVVIMFDGDTTAGALRMVLVRGSMAVSRGERSLH